jgi:SAM-dependent methyltransferase
MIDAGRFYEMQALRYLDDRDRSRVGVEIVERWARSLPFGTPIVEIACGGGYPITQVLVDSGLAVWAIDTSPTLLRQFRLRFPTIPTQCASALESNYFGRTFEAVLSIGLVSFLREDEQLALLHRISEILEPRGRFLFTAPVETGTWQDVTTGLECWSLGRIAYTRALQHLGFRMIRTHVDEGENNYYEAEKIGGTVWW